jgi:hypothetical protein
MSERSGAAPAEASPQGRRPHHRGGRRPEPMAAAVSVRASSCVLLQHLFFTVLLDMIVVGLSVLPVGLRQHPFFTALSDMMVVGLSVLPVCLWQHPFLTALLDMIVAGLSSACLSLATPNLHSSFRYDGCRCIFYAWLSLATPIPHTTSRYGLYRSICSAWLSIFVLPASEARMSAQALSRLQLTETPLSDLAHRFRLFRKEANT